MMHTMNAAAPALTGAAAGGLYHLAKRHLYNTADENAAEDEEGYMPLARRILLPAAGMGAVGAVEANLFPNRFLDKSTGAGGASMLVS